MHEFLLERGEEALGHGVVVAVALGAHRDRDPGGAGCLTEGQGTRYRALILGQRCHQAGIDRSTGARGCALNNAVVEAFFASLKKEKLNRRS